MAADTEFSVFVFTPRGLVFDCEAVEVSLPSVDGEIQVLPAHIGYAGLLGTGVVSVKDASGSVRQLVVSGGFANFVSNSLTLLADSADISSEVDKMNYDSERDQLKSVVETGNTLDPEFIIAREKLSRIEAIDRMIAQ